MISWAYPEEEGTGVPDPPLESTSVIGFSEDPGEMSHQTIRLD